MANYGKYISGRERDLGIGITDYSEDTRVLNVIGNVSIGGSVGIGTSHGVEGRNIDTPTADLDTGTLRIHKELFAYDGTMGEDNTILTSLGGTSVAWSSLESIQDLGITIREEGVQVGSANSIRDVNFVGSLITAAASGIAATITVADVQPGGSDGQVQYNDGGTFGGSADLTYNDSTGRIGINSATPDRQLSVVGDVGVAGSGFFRRAYATVDTLTPQIDQELATKAYVDNFATAGLVVQKAVSVATTEALVAYYDNVDTSPDGVGAILFAQSNENITTAGVGGTGLIDRFKDLTITDRVLVKDQGLNGIGNTFENGYYTVTRIGSGSTSWELTRASDFDQSSEIASGAFSFVLNGDDNAGGGFVLITKEPVSIGVSALEFTQFSSPGELQAGKGLLKVGNRFDVVSLDSDAIVVNDDDINLAQVTVSFADSTTRANKFISEVEIDEYGRVTGIVTSANVSYASSQSNDPGVAAFFGEHFDVLYDGNDGFIGLASNTTGAVMAVDGTTDEITVTRNEGRVILGFPNDITINGTITANSFDGDGSQLDNVISGVGIQTGGDTSQDLIGVGLTILDFVGPVVGVVTGTRGTITISAGADINDVGSANQVLFKDATNTATTSSNLTFVDSTGNLTASGTVTANSDERLKENVETIEDALEKVKQLRGVEYDHKKTGDHCLGVIAQEVEKIVPDVVYEDALGVKSVAYMNMVALLIEAVKDQQKQIDELKSLLNK